MLSAPTEVMNHAKVEPSHSSYSVISLKFTVAVEHISYKPFSSGMLLFEESKISNSGSIASSILISIIFVEIPVHTCGFLACSLNS